MLEAKVRDGKIAKPPQSDREVIEDLEVLRGTACEGLSGVQIAGKCWIRRTCVYYCRRAIAN